jgi:hypothetical protein
VRAACSLVLALAVVACGAAPPPASPANASDAQSAAAPPPAPGDAAKAQGPASPPPPPAAASVATSAPDARSKHEADLGIAWRDFRSDDAGFTVRLPGPVKFDDPPKQGGLSVSSANAADTWFFSVTFFPIDAARGRDPERTLDAERDGALSRVKGTLIAETKVKLGDVPGRDVRARSGEGGLLARFRAFVTPSRSYLLVVVMDPHIYDDAEIDVFFDSFHLGAPAH